MDESTITAKGHHKKQAGPKAEKKKNKKQKQEGLTPQQRNPKAFSYHSVNKVAKRVRRTLDIKEKKHHIPVVDRTPVEPPPIVVAVVGPSKVGKTTLIQCLIKNFTKQRLNTIKGPVTIVSGKKRRITLIECNNDINCMIDLAKIADLVLLLVDASFGFEMEVFEFLNICQVHGFPKIIGVLTHLDHLKNNKALSTTKKRLKHRFWTEVHQGAKLFYLSGMINGQYQDTEIRNLGRFISVMKFRPLQWRTTHPHLLADRMEDVTDPEKLRSEPKCDRNVCLYGYVRGTHLKNNSHVAIPGCGDFAIHDVSFLPDPCPLPDTEKKRSLNEKERLIYAPFSGVGGIVYDKDAVYIDLGGSHAMKGEGDDDKKAPVNKLVSSIMETQATIDQKMGSSKLKLFNDAKPISSDSMTTEAQETNDGRLRRKADVSDDDSAGKNDSDNDDSAFSEDDENDDNVNKIVCGGDDVNEEYEFESEDEEDDTSDVCSLLDQMISSDPKSGEKTKLPIHTSDSEESDGDESDNESKGNLNIKMNSENPESSSLKWKDNMAARAQEAFLARQRQTPNLRKLVYGQGALEGGDNSEENDDEDEIGGLFKVSSEKSKNQKSRTNAYSDINGLDSSKFSITYVRDWLDEGIADCIKDCFVTGKWEADKDARTLLDQDEELYGDFEDLETGEKQSGDGKDDDFSDSLEEENNDDAEQNSDIEGSGDEYRVEDASLRKKRVQDKIKEKREAKKKKLKAMFDAEYDMAGGNDDKGTYFDEWKAEMEQQAQMNREEFQDMDEVTRTQYEGFRSGLYVRVQINNMPCELVEHFDPTFPVLVGGLLNAEQNIGMVHVRLKKHRWHKKILKTRDPVIVSLGWRRFQTLTLFSIQDHNGRHRLLKYTPEHLHCDATFWGPITPQNTGFLTIETVGANTSDFRISSTGAVLELDKSFTIMKKLKLTGTPYKIYKKTAFIQGMFNSNLEVAKFEGSSIRTVSGIRGQIKRSVKEGEAGSFRATFEDKILLSDIAFVKTWYPVDVPKFYNPVTTLLEEPEQRIQWKGMRTVGEIRREKGIKRKVDEDHLYRTAERKKRRHQPLIIPKELQQNLPFKDKPKVLVKKKDQVQTGRVAVVRSAKERKVAQLMKMLKMMNREKNIGMNKEMRVRVKAHKKEKAKINALRDQKHKEIKKKVFRLQGMIEKKK